MPLNIENDVHRFRQIVRGQVRRELRRHMSNGELIGKEGGKVVRVPLPQIGIPRFRYGENQQGGIGQGEGEKGDPVGGGPPGPGQAGAEPGEHELEGELSLEELASILGEELELPRIEPRGSKEIKAHKDRYTGIARQGPESLRHHRRTFREALKRQVQSGAWQPQDPRIVPIRDDQRYRTWKVRPEPQSSAVIVYMMDVSGSMGREQKEIVRLEAFWIDLWLSHNYKNVRTHFIIHDAAAREVDRDTFFRTRESGGTLISSAYKLCAELIEAHYPPAEWNIYPFHFSDGDNWSKADTELCMELLRRRLLPVANQFSYAQVDSEYGSGQFYEDLKAKLGDDVRLTLSRVPDRDHIMDSIKELLGKGR